MSDKQFMKNNTPELGNITVSKEVAAIIAALETIKVKGVVGISSGHKAGSVNVLPKKDIAKGIEVWMKPGEAAVTISIITDYEVGIFKVAEEVQKKTKNAIEVMTGLKVLKINVNVHGVKFKEETKKTKEKKQKDIKK
ncbi:MAG: Asp23/Gls24 family envelope stress response protein [Candidatus Atribacteria bacterium]|nr:Asp23/Gls24 family envelope stress response protein [Candidatus Atribacteria bacterium]MCK4309138.1 Asp23/Gls24 family envelope stress response protein [Candidatus Atribacteria bacterium]